MDKIKGSWPELSLEPLSFEDELKRKESTTSVSSLKQVHTGQDQDPGGKI